MSIYKCGLCEHIVESDGKPRRKTCPGCGACVTCGEAGWTLVEDSPLDTPVTENSGYVNTHYTNKQ